jgi:hypothetical protein
MGRYVDNASRSLPGTALREISHGRQQECCLNDKKHRHELGWVPASLLSHFKL